MLQDRLENFSQGGHKFAFNVATVTITSTKRTSAISPQSTSGGGIVMVTSLASSSVETRKVRRRPGRGEVCNAHQPCAEGFECHDGTCAERCFHNDDCIYGSCRTVLGDPYSKLCLEEYTLDSSDSTNLIPVQGQRKGGDDGPPKRRRRRKPRTFQRFRNSNRTSFINEPTRIISTDSPTPTRTTNSQTSKVTLDLAPDEESMFRKDWWSSNYYINGLILLVVIIIILFLLWKVILRLKNNSTGPFGGGAKDPREGQRIATPSNNQRPIISSFAHFNNFGNQQGLLMNPSTPEGYLLHAPDNNSRAAVACQPIIVVPPNAYESSETYTPLPSLVPLKMVQIPRANDFTLNAPSYPPMVTLIPPLSPPPYDEAVVVRQ